MLVDYEKQIFYAGQNLQKAIFEKIIKNDLQKSKMYFNDKDAMGLLRKHFDLNKTTPNYDIQETDNNDADDIINELAFYEISNIVLEKKSEVNEKQNSEVLDIILDTIINVSKLSNAGFSSNKQYEIFISHSHRDIIDIDKLIMDKFEGRVCFIDSKTWECIYELEKIIISNFKKRLDAVEHSNPVLYEKIEKNISIRSGKFPFEYDKFCQFRRSVETAFDVILATSLGNVMKNCKYFVFIPTDNSCYKNVNKTLSSWIYYENQIAKYFFTKKEYIKQYEENEDLNNVFQTMASDNNYPFFEFDLSYDKLDEIKGVGKLMQYFN